MSFDDCALNTTTKANMQNSVDKFSMASDNFGLTISTKKPVSGKPYVKPMTEGGRKVHLPQQHPL